jgi:glucosamine--fructose-6-phosphate aminotransferase (isomerizing)
VIGEGPNMGTACEAALVLSETTKFPWIGISAGQYDHGPKETAESSAILFLNGGGKSAKRIEYLKKLLTSKTDAAVLELREENLPEALSPFPLSVRVCFFMNYLADHLKIQKTFHLGSKVTKVPDSLK